MKIMKFLMICLFLTANVFAYTTYYVDRDSLNLATRQVSGNGLTWATAKKTVHELPWSSISAGDIIYISGGTDSTLYQKDYIWNKVNAGSPIIVTKGVDSGHNGEVYFTQTGVPSSDIYSFEIGGTSQGIKLTGLHFITSVDSIYHAVKLLSIVNSTYITVENCHITSTGNGNSLVIGAGTDHITVNNDSIEVLTNYIPQNDGTESDCIQDWGNGGNTYTNNFIMNNSMYGETGGVNPGHSDKLQFIAYGSVNNYETVIANNFFYSDARGSNGLSYGIYASSPHSNRFLIYNNIFANNTSTSITYADINLSPVSTTYNVSLRAYNNTFRSVTKGNYKVHQIVVDGNIDTVIIKNNMMVSDSGSIYAIHFSVNPHTSVGYLDVDYNHYWGKGGTQRMVDVNTDIIWGTWRSYSYDIHSDTGTVSWANAWGDSIGSYKLAVGSPGIDAGTNLSTSIPATDIEGTARGTSWDLGALELTPGTTYWYVSVGAEGVGADDNGYTLPSGGATVANNGVLNIVAVPYSGYVFKYWKVDSSGTIKSYSASYNATITCDVGFTAYFDYDVPAAPTLISPAQDADSISLSTTLIWNAVTNATYYKVDVDTVDNTFGAMKLNGDSVTVTYRALDWAGLTVSHKYYWRIKAGNATGLSSFSVVDSFTTVPGVIALVTPTPTFPVGLTNQPLILALTWNAVPGATSYKIMIASSANYTSGVIEDSTLVIITNQLSVSLPAINTSYFWQVKSVNDLGSTAWSEQKSFTTLMCH